MGAAGFAIDAGLSDATEEEAQIKRLMVESATEVVGLVDHTKWGRTAFATFCRTADLTAVVTDRDAPTAMIQELRRSGVEVREVAPDDVPSAHREAPGLRAGGSAPW
jgi:DeoR family transcriptional regulator of aga operon/DeoR family fructose operon transcriptional repressor